jgi:hemerythrin
MIFKLTNSEFIEYWSTKMPLFKWIDEYSIGISIIDNQHKKIIDYINELHDAIQQNIGFTATGDVLTDIAEKFPT